jgi:hypothetical protein
MPGGWRPQAALAALTAGSGWGGGSEAGGGDAWRPAAMRRAVAAVVREVEVKFRVRDPAVLIAALDARGIQLGRPVEQDD